MKTSINNYSNEFKSINHDSNSSNVQGNVCTFLVEAIGSLFSIC
jgi:hypothetical protein